jgi:hypothetical protein
MEPSFYTDKLKKYHHHTIDEIRIVNIQSNVFEFICDKIMTLIFYFYTHQVIIYYDGNSHTFTLDEFDEYVKNGTCIGDDEMQKYQTVLFDILNEPLIKSASKLF